MPKPKRVDPIKQREKRAKIAAGVGVLLLVVIGGIEIPPVLHTGPPPGAASPPPTTPADTSTAPATGTGSAVPAGGELADTDAPPVAASGELVSFSAFQSKNPFAPQVAASVAGSTSSSSSPTTANKAGADIPASTTPTSTTATTTTTPSATASIVPPSGTATTPATTTPTAPQVTISVNGTSSHLADEDTFPSGAPVFRLASFTSTSAEVAIVGGSYASGGATLTLRLHEPVTLENQTDGKKYTLELVSTTS